MISHYFHAHNFLPETCGPTTAQSAIEPGTESAGLLVLSIDDLPAVCPNGSTPLWASHPRIFLDVVNEKEAMCPYCGARYQLRSGTRVHDHEFGAGGLHQHRPRRHAEPPTDHGSGRA
jgi:uncharacterized Zn-finger protein